MTPTTLTLAPPANLAAVAEDVSAHTWLAGHVEVRNADEAGAATKLIREIKVLAASLETQRASVGKPLLEAKRTVDGWFKPHIDELTRCEGVLKGKVAQWQTAERQRQTAALQAAAQAHVAGDHAAAATALAVSNAATTEAPVGTTVKEVWQARIVDPTAVPREWCIPDEKRIAAHARACPGSSVPAAIAGVVFERVSTMAVRK